MTQPVKNWFNQGGSHYARFRPQYPAALASYLASIAPNTDLAVDIGCGTGQLSKDLATHFQTVLGVDPSLDQLAHAATQSNLHYLCSTAEQLAIPERRASLITAAQAAHWFDLPAFYQEARRIAQPGAILALISYGVLQVPAPLAERFNTFYWTEIGPYWPAERQLVDSGYATLDFPFDERPPAAIKIRNALNLEGFLGYISTWSAVRQASEAGRADILQRFAHDMAELWGDSAAQHPIAWPINMRIGVL